MVLRARYFFTIWDRFLDCAGYSPAKKYSFSRECRDIIQFLINGFIGLLYVHRDLEETTPFLPWLHSSEACEHVFGMCRRIVPDFCYTDFLHMIPKLRVSLRRAGLRARVSDGKERARGYNITYFDTYGMDPLVLAAYPDDTEISNIATAAYDEAGALMTLLGVDPDTLRVVGRRFPSLTKQVPAPIDTDNSDSDSDFESDSDVEDSAYTFVAALATATSSNGFRLGANAAERREMETYGNAAAALAVEDHMSAYVPVQ